MDKQFDFSISAVGGEIDEDVITKALEAVGLTEIQVERLLNFEAVVAGLPDKEIDRLNEICVRWAYDYGLGGGEHSTEEKLRAACDECKSNNPRVIAKAMYEKIAGHSHTSFEASGIVYECFKSIFSEDE